jgi:hypothetical protein
MVEDVKSNICSLFELLIGRHGEMSLLVLGPLLYGFSKNTASNKLLGHRHE